LVINCQNGRFKLLNFVQTFRFVYVFKIVFQVIKNNYLLVMILLFLNEHRMLRSWTSNVELSDGYKEQFQIDKTTSCIMKKYK